MKIITKSPIALIALLIFISFFSFDISAENVDVFSAKISEMSGKVGDTVEVSINCNGTDTDVGGFVVNINYDSDIFEYVKVKLSDSVTEGYSYTGNSDGLVASVYTAKSSGTVRPITGNTFTYVFKIKENSYDVESMLEVSILQMVTFNGVKIEGDRYISFGFFVEPRPDENSRLLNLAPPTGTLFPDFNENIYNYTLEVPYEITTLVFDVAIPKDASYTVNRKNLGAGGSEVDFVFNVTAADKKTKSQYVVTVLRNTKLEDEREDIKWDSYLTSLVPPTGQLVPDFNKDIYNYTLEVPYEIKTLVFEATPISGATYTVNRRNLGAGGSEVDFIFNVTAADKKTKSQYIVTVLRANKIDDNENSELISEKADEDAQLVDLIPPVGELSPAFSKNIYDYKLEVPYEMKTLVFDVILPNNATYTVNRRNLGAGGSEVDFIFTVTAADRKTKSQYIVTVFRANKPDDSGDTPEPIKADSHLTALIPPVGKLVPDFDENIYSYTLDVPYEVKTLAFDVTPVKDATYTVNRKNLGAGGSEVDFVFNVTSGDKKTKSQYTVTVYRGIKIAEEKVSSEKSSSSKSTASNNTATGTKATTTGAKIAEDEAETSSKLTSSEESSKDSEDSESDSELEGGTAEEKGSNNSNRTPSVTIEQSGMSAFLMGMLSSVGVILLAVVICVLVISEKSPLKKLKNFRNKFFDNKVIAKLKSSMLKIVKSKK